MDLVHWLVIGETIQTLSRSTKREGDIKVPISVNTTKFDMCYLEQVEYHNYVSFAKSVFEI